jgi:hypothetical protein
MKNIHVLPTNKPSRFCIKVTDGFQGYDFHLYDARKLNTWYKPQYLYITSDEEIKEGDYVYSIKQGYNIQKVSKGLVKSYQEVEHYKKIILTTDQSLEGVQAIDDEFLEWFVKNPSCEEVEVTRDFADEGIKGITYYGKYFIIIPQEEPKQEIWKNIPNYEGLYQVSNFGNVKSLEKYVKGKVENRLQKENILSKRLVGNLGNQYYAVTLCNNKDRKQIKVSVLVAMAFLNHTPNGYVGFTVDHIDNNPLNNNVDNLQVITKRENSSKDRKGISKYTGVTFNKKSNKWRSQIWINGKNKTLGSFDDELEAHRAYQKELQQHLKS